jgi:hypothetical protein
MSRSKDCRKGEDKGMVLSESEDEGMVLYESGGGGDLVIMQLEIIFVVALSGFTTIFFCVLLDLTAVTTTFFVLVDVTAGATTLIRP